MSAQVRICRDCGEEFNPSATRCSDCGGELEDRVLDESGAVLGAEDAPPDDAPDAEATNHRIVFVTHRAAELVPLAEALRAEGVAYHLAERSAQTEGAAPSYALLVPADAVAAALRALAPHVAPEHEAGDVEGVESHFASERGYLRCPACGAEQPPGATECGECGLLLGAAEEEAATCARCGAPLAEPDQPCGACGSTRVG
jgi:ribosomal protein L40E